MTDLSVRTADALRWLRWGSKVFVRGTVTVAQLARSGQLDEAMEPLMTVDDAADIDYGQLAARGIKAILFDLENTLIPPRGPFNESGRGILEAVRSAGMQCGVVSNCSAAWVAKVLEPEGIPFVSPGGKPGTKGFLRACKLLGVAPSEVVFVGDQVITDVVGAKLAGMEAILVRPRYAGDALSSRFQRVLVKVLARKR